MNVVFVNYQGMVMSALEFAQKANEIFVMSDSFVRIKELIDDESSTIDDIADVILIDPALAGTILKLANSSFFNYPGKIDTISKAVLVLGITEVYNLVIAYFTADAFKSISASADYLEDFWERSVDTALLMSFIGRHLKIPNAERTFILGLLHNLGELIVNQFMPEKIEECLVEPLTMMPWDKQKEVLGFSYGECSGALLKEWQLPFSIIEPIYQQDHENFEEVSKEGNLLFLAKRIVVNQVQYPKLSIEQFITQEQLDDLGVEKELINAAISHCDMERLNVLSLLKPSSVMIF